jgi:hypothetical protein
MIISLFENEHVTCELDDSLPVLRHRWKKDTTGEAFKSNLLKILAEYRKLKKSYTNLAWLADTILLGELDEETHQWLVDVWENLIFAQGEVKIHAVILGKNIFADYPMESFKEDAEQKYEHFDVHLDVFSNQADAYRWIAVQQLALK